MELIVGAKFIIRVKFNGNFYRYTVALVEITEREEIFHVIAKSKTLVFRNNRPFFRNRGLKHRRLDWNADEALPYQSFIHDIVSEIERNIGL